MIEELKARHPDLPVPVFSTMALAHGQNSQGAVSVRSGFSWNPRMDLLWALGYPNVVLIVDGLPEGDSRQSMIEHWEGKGHGGWLSRSEAASELVLPRRAAYGVVHEMRHGQDPFELDDVAFQAATEPGPLDAVETASLLRNLKSQNFLARASLVLESLIGPSAVLEVLCAIAEDPAFDARASEFRGRAVSATKPLLRRVPEAEANSVKERLSAIQREPGRGFDSFIRGATDPLAHALSKFEAGKDEYALGNLEWVDGRPDLVLKAYDAQSSFPDIPTPRYLFVGNDELLERELTNAKKYNPGDLVESHLAHYTAIQSPKLLPTELALLSKRDARAAMTAWLVAHASSLRAWVEELAKDPTSAKSAVTALKLLPE